MSLSCVVCAQHIGTVVQHNEEDYGTICPFPGDDAQSDVCIECIVKLVRSLKGSRGRVIEAAADSMSKGGRHSFAASPWISVTERMPPAGTPVLAMGSAMHDESGPLVVTLGADGVWRYGDGAPCDVTHWAELHEPATVKARE